MDNKLNLIGLLRHFCKDNGIFFIAGPKDYQNAVMDYHTYDKYELILVADFTFKPIMTDNDIDAVQYNGTLALGRKNEMNTTSSLDETFQQKYDSRLLELSKILCDLLLQLQCEYDATIDSATMSYALNQYDLNCDFVSSDIQLTI